MNLLAAKLYDPATAVSKATSSLLAMTAFDTTNLRLAVTVPAHGMLYIRIMGGALSGATTLPTILLGILNGVTVIARQTPQDYPGTMNAATQSCPLYAEFIVTGLTPGAMNLDLAYGVEVIVASTAIKYGGPNDTTTNNAWGGISFQVWDPQPQTANTTLAVDASGRVDAGKIAGTAQTAGDLKASLNTLQADTDDIQTRLPAALISGRIDASVGAMATDVITSGALATTAVNEIRDSILSDATRFAGANIDDRVTSRMATYTQPAGFLAASFPTDPADESLIIAATDAIMSRIGAPAGASVSADVAGVPAAVLSAATAAPIAANTKKINGTTVNGDGSATPWGP